MADLLKQRVRECNIVMNYSYDWNIKEFMGCESRLQGCICRLLYTVLSSSDDLKRWVYVVPSEFAEFSDAVKKICQRFDIQLCQEVSTASIIFVYFPCELDLENDEIMNNLFQKNAIICALLGEAEFLPPATTSEEERMRGLSSFRVGQEITQFLKAHSYEAVDHHSVEYESSESASKTINTSCSDSEAFRSVNVKDMSAVFKSSEKWEIYAPCSMDLGDRIHQLATHPEEVKYWEDEMLQHACVKCRIWTLELKICARCKKSTYCSRECQKADWKRHKSFCVI